MKRRGITRWYEFEDWVKHMMKREKKLTLEDLDAFLEEQENKPGEVFIPLGPAAEAEFDKAMKMGVANYIMEGDLEELGFKNANQPVTLKVEEGFEDWDAMYTKFSEERGAGKFWGCTIYTKRSDPKYIRIDGAHAPNAVYGHLGMERWRGHIDDMEDIQKQLETLNYK